MTKTSRWRLPLGAIIVVLLVAGGITAITYPTASNWLYQYQQAQIIQDYGTMVAKAAPPPPEQLENARKYNQALRFGAKVEANHRLPTGSGSVGHGVVPYAQQLQVDDSGMMGRLRIRKIDVDLPIYHGTDDDTLLKGVGHLEGTSLPIGGAGSHAVLTAHRGLAEAAMFTNLDRIKEGDTFSLEVLGEVLTYKVEKTQVVKPEDTQSLRVQAGRDLVTLITCTPLGVNSHRILVTAHRIPTPADAPPAASRSELPHFPWWAVWLGATYLLSILFIWHEGRPQTRANIAAKAARKKKKHRAEKKPSKNARK